MTTAKDIIRDFAKEMRELGEQDYWSDEINGVKKDEIMEEKLDQLMKEIADKICN